MSEGKQEKLPLDARLLADAVIELNISRRSVSLYPPEHPIIQESIERAFGHLQKLFDIRSGITLGIAKDALVIDEFTLDRRNPVFREFAETLHARGLAAVTVASGLSRTELVKFHELISDRESGSGEELSARAVRDCPHIRLSPIDFDNFTFVEGGQRGSGGSAGIWEDYVYGLIEGKLGEGTGPSILEVPEETVADIVNRTVTEQSSKDNYDRVITAYIRKTGESRMSSDAFNKFVSFINKLRPEVKRQFLSRAGAHLSADLADVEAVISDMTPEMLEKVAGLFTDNASLIPTTLKNLIDKLSATRKHKSSYFDFFYEKSAVFDDIELGDDVIKLFGDDHFHAYVGEEYQRELERMLSAGARDSVALAGRFREECTEEFADRAALDIMLELLHAEILNPRDYLELVTRLSEYIHVFIETGRFEEVLEAYNTLSAQTLSGTHREEAASAVEYFFHSPELISKLVDAFRLWGRREREGAFRLARALRKSLIAPLLDALIEERDASMRKFLLSLLEAIGSDVLPHAVRRLQDERWYVLRNMIALVRECNGIHEIEKIRKFVKHKNAEVCLEAVRTLMEFRTPDAILNLRTCLQSDHPELRKGAVRLAGAYGVGEVVPELIRHLEKRDLFGTEAADKMDIVRALGDIGDSRAIGPLQKILRARSFLYKGIVDELKAEIFRNLEHYPAEAIGPLVAEGLQAKSEEIRALAGRYAAGSPAPKGTGK